MNLKISFHQNSFSCGYGTLTSCETSSLSRRFYGFGWMSGGCRISYLPEASLDSGQASQIKIAPVASQNPGKPLKKKNSLFFFLLCVSPLAAKVCPSGVSPHGPRGFQFRPETLLLSSEPRLYMSSANLASSCCPNAQVMVSTDA